MSNLGTKETGLFKAAINYYEIKQYKRGLKACEQILTKYPDHGETLALKGLFLLFLDKREEGFEICKKGLKLSLQSHISWHVLGLMHRQDKNYEESIKCYKNALRIDKDNFQILRDLALLQLQCRQLDGAIDSRRKIILTKPTAPFNWMSIIVAYHLSGNLKQALDIFNIYLDLFKNIKDHAENHLYYKVFLMLEIGLYNETIDFMKKNFERKNTRRYFEMLNEAAFSAKMYELCEETLMKLIDINPDCLDYILKGYELYKVQGKDINVFFELIFEKSLLAAVEVLSFVDSEIFKSKFSSVFKVIMEKNSPASFHLFKGVLNIEERREIVWDSLLRLDQDNLSVIIFKVKYLAFVNNLSDALALINLSIESYPENNDLIMLKSRVLKKMSKYNEALVSISLGKNLVSNDKFSLSKIAKYMIKFGSISEAQEIIGKFIQKSNQKECMADLHEMQAVWYLVEMADRLFKDGNILNAACFYRKINLVFDEFIDDQLDFHSYSLRKMSFVEYIKFLRFFDNQLKKSEISKRAQIGLAYCLLTMIEEDSDMESLTQKFGSSTISHHFEDDLTIHFDFFRTLFTVKKNVLDFLHRICDNLLSNHCNDESSLNCSLKISLKLGKFLSIQKITMKLAENGYNISDDIVNQINNYRNSQGESLWQNVPLLN